MDRFQRIVRWLRPKGSKPSAETVAERVMSHYRTGVTCYRDRKFRDAVRHFSTAISMAPGHAGMYQHRGAALAELGRFPQAINDYDRAIHLNPAFADTYLDRGNAYHALGQRDKAIKDYSEALRLRPSYGEAYANRAAVLLETGQEAPAEADAKRARELNIDEGALDRLLSAARSSARREKARR